MTTAALNARLAGAHSFPVKLLASYCDDDHPAGWGHTDWPAGMGLPVAVAPNRVGERRRLFCGVATLGHE